MAALRHHRIDAPWVVDGPINGETFLLYEKILRPDPPALRVARKGARYAREPAPQPCRRDRR